MIDESKTTDPVEQHRFYFHINNGNRYPGRNGICFFPMPTTPPRMLLLSRRNWRKTRAGVESSLS
jgi:hypothetical protein